MPPGFLEDFAARFEEEGLQECVETIASHMMARCSRLSLLADAATPLALLERLARCKPIARALTRSPRWLPRQQDGRTLEFQSLLGSAFGISALSDPTTRTPFRQPDVAAQCFSDPDQRAPTDLHHSRGSIQMAAGQLRRSLHAITMAFLQNKDTRDSMLSWLAAVLDSNSERDKMRPDMKKAGTDGFMLNVAGVMLQLCEPFMDPLTGKAWPRLDARYVSDPAARTPCSLEITRLGADSEAVRGWAGAGGSGGSGAPYHFICECFFMTTQALRLGLLKTMEFMRSMGRAVQHYQEDLATAEAALQANPSNYRARMEADACRAAVAIYKSRLHCYDALLQDRTLLTDALAFYRLLSAYLLRLASPSAARGGPPSLPLPLPAPMEFTQLPEFYVEDMCELLLWVGRVGPQLVESRKMEELMSFFTVFLGSPAYVKNPYLRGKMVEALHSYMPPEDPGEGSAGGAASWRRRRTHALSSQTELATLFEVHPLVVQNMVKSLIELYIDIEFTDRHNVFYEKFTTRYQIGEVLAHLWNLPQHRAAWQAVARDHPKLYVRFINMMINDSQHLLQEALETLPRVQETERLMEDAPAWAALPAAEREDRQSALQQHQRVLGSDFYLASVCVRTMQYTSEDRAVAPLFFQAEVRDRMARILDFFLKYLTVPEERKKLKVKDPERYNWRPKELIAQLAAIHLNLYRTHQQEWVEAIVADEGYYGNAPQMFPEMLGVLRTLGLMGAQDVADLQALVAQVEQTKLATTAEEEAFDEVPDEFEDPLLGGIMKDPVLLPSGQVVDRKTIVQQLMNDPRDPFNRQPMTEDDLVPQTELQQQIQQWLAEQRANRMQQG